MQEQGGGGAANSEAATGREGGGGGRGDAPRSARRSEADLVNGRACPTAGRDATAVAPTSRGHRRSRRWVAAARWAALRHSRVLVIFSDRRPLQAG